MTVQAEQTVLDHYILGEVYSQRPGTKCLPAIEKSTGRRCILKIYEVPKDVTVTEVMLLCGAFQSRDELSDYYKKLSLELCRQAAIMNALSANGGFSHYLTCQIIQVEDMGYRIYLLSPFEKTLAVKFEKELFSNKEIIRLACDLCRSLKVAREAGYIYVGLKPQNIFCTGDGYVIGDLGFIPLSSLPYRSLPQSYHNIYTPASSHDCFGTIPDKCDLFSLGKVLLQACCGGHLPKKELPDDNPLLQVILKACEPDSYPTLDSFEEALRGCSLP